MVRKSAMAGLLLLVSACGGGDDAAMMGTVNTQQAQASVRSSVMLRSAVESMTGPTVASNVLAVNSSTSGIVTPAMPATTGALIADAVEQVSQAQATGGSQMCTASGCTFDNYVTGGYTFNGKVDVAAGSGDGKNVKWDLTIKGAGTGIANPFALDYNGKGDLQVSATSLSGTVYTKATTSGSAQGQSFTGGYEADVKFTAVTLSGNMATGGTVWAKMKSTGSSGGQTATQIYEGTLEFGK